MTPALLLPAGLVALAALLIPLLVHLVRREAQTPVDFAALRWLASRIRPRRHIRFDERLLLALRLLLVALLSLLLARPVLFAAPDTRPWIVAAPGVPAATLLATAITGSDTPERRWLAPGFPTADAATPIGTPTPATSLLRELDMRMPAGAPLIVLVPPILEGVDAERPKLSRAVDWRVVDAVDAAGAAASGGDTSADPANPSATVPPPKLVIRHSADRADAARYLRAAAAAWQPDADVDIDLAIITPGAGLPAVPDDAGAVAWLAPGHLPPALLDWIDAGGTVLAAHDATPPVPDDAPARWRDDDGRVLVRAARLGQGQVLQWTRGLQPESLPALLEADFPHRLKALLAAPTPPPSRVAATGHAPLVDAAVGPWPQAARELSSWLALLIGLLFLIERWLAASPRRGHRGQGHA